MKNKKLIVGLGLAAVLVIPFSVFAATSSSPVAQNIRHFLRIDVSKLNDSQKADVKTYQEKMSTVQKDFINQMVANGSITKEQGDVEISRIDESLKNGAGVRGLPGLDQGMKKGGERGPRGLGMFDLSKLTDAQKADLKTSHLAMLNLQKEYISKMVSNNLLTKDQGDKNTKKIDEIIANIDKEDVAKGPGLFMRGLEGYAPRLNDSKLTEQQKADLKEFTTKMDTLQKELLNKMVASGAITKEQADKFNNRITNKPNLQKGDSQQGRFGRQDGQRRGFQQE